MIQFGEWLPDQTDFGVPISVAQNVLPAARGYRSVNNLATLSGAADDRLRKVFAAKDNTAQRICSRVMARSCTSLTPAPARLIMCQRLATTRWVLLIIGKSHSLAGS
jgi:hypothetical protein